MKKKKITNKIKSTLQNWIVEQSFYTTEELFLLFLVSILVDFSIILYTILDIVKFHTPLVGFYKFITNK